MTRSAPTKNHAAWAGPLLALLGLVTCFAVSAETSEESARLAEGPGLELPLLSDVEREAVRARGVAHEEGLPGQVIARPASFLVERDGTISWRSLTDNWRIRLRPEELLEVLGADP